MPEEQHSDVSYDEDNVEIEDDDRYDDETGPDSEDNDDEIVYTIEAEIPKYKKRSAKFLAVKSNAKRTCSVAQCMQ